jgi:GxxExxY protein
MKHEELTQKIIGCAMTVHSCLGNGYQELVYQKSLAIEFELKVLPLKVKRA